MDRLTALSRQWIGGISKLSIRVLSIVGTFALHPVRRIPSLVAVISIGLLSEVVTLFSDASSGAWVPVIGSTFAITLSIAHAGSYMLRVFSQFMLAVGPLFMQIGSASIKIGFASAELAEVLKKMIDRLFLF